MTGGGGLVAAAPGTTLPPVKVHKKCQFFPGTFTTKICIITQHTTTTRFIIITHTQLIRLKYDVVVSSEDFH